MWLPKNEVPTSEGWYWCKYYNKHKKIEMCPCRVTLFKDKQFVVSTARNDIYSSNNKKQFGVIWISKERIPEPE